MWDWDTEQVARKKSARPIKVWTIGGIAAFVLAVVLIRLVVFILLHVIPGTEPGPSIMGGTDARPTLQPGGSQAGTAEDFWFGDQMSAKNPDPLNLGATETLLLGNADSQLRLTPGAVSIRGACGQEAAVIVMVTTVAVRGPAMWDPTAFRMIDADGQEQSVLGSCLASPAPLRSGDQQIVELPFGAAPTWLVYAPGDGRPLGRWRLS